MARPVIAWSYSALSMFENCPFKYWAVKVGKIVSDYNKDNAEGNEDHDSLQHHLQKGLALPEKLRSMQAITDRIRASPGEMYVEYSMALTQDFTPTKWNDWDNVWVRGAGDVVKINGSKATYLDWKKGKYRDSEDQIDITSLLLFRHFPAVQTVKGGMVFYNAGRVFPHVVQRADESRLWNGFISRVKVLEQAKTDDLWPKTPNPLCGWCPVMSCPHNKVEERLAKEAKKS